MLMDLLTDPKLYQGKKKGHKSRVLAGRFQMDKEFQKERTLEGLQPSTTRRVDKNALRSWALTGT